MSNIRDLITRYDNISDGYEGELGWPIFEISFIVFKMVHPNEGGLKARVRRRLALKGDKHRRRFKGLQGEPLAAVKNINSNSNLAAVNEEQEEEEDLVTPSGMNQLDAINLDRTTRKAIQPFLKTFCKPFL